MELSQKLQKRRKEMKLTQEEVAEKIYVSRQTISNWENGRTLPDIKSLVLISDIYEISLDDLIKEDTRVIKKLSMDSKQVSQWFILSNFFSACLSVFICIQYRELNPNMTMFLIVFQTMVLGYIMLKGIPFLKENRMNFEDKSKQEKFIVNWNIMWFILTVITGISTVLWVILLY